MNDKSKAVDFMYGTVIGRTALKIIMTLHLDRIAVAFLRSPFSRILVPGYVRRNNIDVSPEELASFRSYREMFVRTRPQGDSDPEPGHLISPCDGLLSAFPIDAESSFLIKNSRYRLRDFLNDESLAEKYVGGTCLVFRLCASDYHHYCYIDDAYQGENRFIPGRLHSVQPIACEKYPVFVLNRRSCCLLETDNFGPVVQCEIGALVVGGIVNHREKERVKKGEEKGHFDLAGSTIVLLFEKERIKLRGSLADELSHAEEVRVKQGQWIANAI